MLHTYEKSALACAVIDLKRQNYAFRDYSPKVIVIRTIKLDVRDKRFKAAVAYTAKCIQNIEIEGAANAQ